MGTTEDEAPLKSRLTPITPPGIFINYLDAFREGPFWQEST